MRPASSVPRLQGLCPLIQVFDMRRSLAFYRDLLGFEVVERAPAGDDCDWAWLRSGSAELMLNTMYEAPDRPDAPDEARTAAHGDTMLFIGAPDVDAVYSHLRAQGVGVEAPVVAPYGMKQLSLRDPDGYGVCFQWRAITSSGGTSSASP
jgi:catechol 2,3-dioxygenase-like lactoylglutathione lyase family enzyme